MLDDNVNGGHVMAIQGSRRHFVEGSAPVVVLGIALLGMNAWAQVDVRVVEPERRDFELVTTLPGTAEAFYEADLGAKVSGYVSELLVDIGDLVQAGQVLARITVPELIEARNAAAAQVAADESEYERIAMLAERNSVTKRALTEAKSRLDAARAKQAEIDAQIDYAAIESPFDGVVTARTIDPGDIVYEASSSKGGNQPLLRVAKVDVIRLKTYVAELDAAWVDVGDSASVAFNALAGRVFTGQVSRTAQSLDPATRTLLVEIDLPNADGWILPGYYGRARIVLERRENALAVPSAAVRTDGGRSFVYVVGAGESARATPIDIGLDVGGWAEVTRGLSGNERVVADGVGALVDGAPVRVAVQ